MKIAQVFQKVQINFKHYRKEQLWPWCFIDCESTARWNCLWKKSSRFFEKQYNTFNHLSWFTWHQESFSIIFVAFQWITTASMWSAFYILLSLCVEKNFALQHMILYRYWDMILNILIAALPLRNYAHSYKICSKFSFESFLLLKNILTS